MMNQRTPTVIKRVSYSVILKVIDEFPVLVIIRCYK